jgi:hypothetical protein
VETDLLRHQRIVTRPKIAASFVVPESGIPSRSKPELRRTIRFGSILKVVVCGHSARHLWKIVSHVGVHALATTIAISESGIAVSEIANWVCSENSTKDSSRQLVRPDVFVHDFWPQWWRMLHVTRAFLLRRMQVLA